MRKGFFRQRAYEIEGARLITYTLASVYRNPKANSFPSLHEFLPLEIDIPDKKQTVKQIQAAKDKATKKEETRLKKMMAAIHKKMNHGR